MKKELDRVFEVDHYRGVKIEEYRGVYGLLAIQKGSGANEVWFKRWVFMSRFKDGKSSPQGNPRPMAVRLGDKETALKTLMAVWEYISNNG